MRTIKRYIPVFLLGMIIWFTFDNKEIITNFFDTAEVEFTKHFGEFSSSGYLVNEQDLSNLEDSGITGKDYKPNSNYYPYYDFLTVEGQLIYKQIYENMKALAPTFIPVVNITSTELQTVMEAVYNDHPELFWINTSYSYKYIDNNIVVQITLDYNDTKENIKETKKQFDAVANEIIANAKKYNSDYEKELYVHDELLKLIKYDTNASFNQSAYSALVNGKTVCAGYARAFQYIMIELGIPTYYVTGYSNQDHAWNIIKLDGEYYNVDLTWNDTSIDHHQFFNLTDTEFSSTHKRKSLSTKLPYCNGSKYQYSNPEREEIPTSNENDSTSSNTPSTNNPYDHDYYEHPDDIHEDYDHDSSYPNENHHNHYNH